MRGWRLVLVASALAGLATFTAPIAAAPLCRDTKGLFTPCPSATNRKARQILSTAPAERVERPSAAETVRSSQPAGTRSTPTHAADRAVSPGPTARPVDRTPTHRRKKLCTDTKGLFTPCPK